MRAVDSTNDVARAEAELARRCAEGDRAAQLALFHAHRAAVHRTLYRVLGTNRHMEDLLQETFIAVFRSIGTFRAESSLRTWIDTVAVRVSYRYLARREPRGAHLHAVAELPSDAPDPERIARGREAARRLYAVLDRVEPKQRIAFALHVVDDRPIKEIARLTDSSALAVKNRIWRARAKLNALALRDPILRELLGKQRGTP